MYYFAFVLYVGMGIFFSFPHQSFASDTGQTLDALSQKIQQLKKQNELLGEKIFSLYKEYENLFALINKNITGDEKKMIYATVLDLKNSKETYEKKIREAISSWSSIEPIQEEMFQKYLYLFQTLLPYVDEGKKEEYITYVRKHLTATKEKKDVAVDLLRTEMLFLERLQTLKNRILLHQESLQSKIEQAAIDKIESKIQEIEKKYGALPVEKKREMYMELVSVLEEKITELENSNLSKNYIQLRKNIFEKMIQKILQKIEE